MADKVIVGIDDLTALADAARDNLGETQLYSLNELTDAVSRASALPQDGIEGQIVVMGPNGKPVWDIVPQGDWAENDETSPAYIKNRTHYEAYETGVMLAEKSPDMIQDGQAFYAYPCLEAEPAAGAEYTVNWNGVEYKCISVDGAELGEPGTVVVGDYGSLLGGESTGEPFVIMMVGEEMAASEGLAMMVYIIDGTTELTMSISYAGNVVHKLDNKYLDLSKYATREETDSKIEEINTNLFSNYLTVSQYEYLQSQDTLTYRGLTKLTGKTDTGTIDVSKYKALLISLSFGNISLPYDDEIYIKIYDANNKFLCNVPIARETQYILAEIKYNRALMLDLSYITNGYPMEMKRYVKQDTADITLGTIQLYTKNGTAFPDMSNMWLYGVVK